MSEREPAVLLDEPVGGTAAAVPAPTKRPSTPALQRPKREAPAVYVVGFWKRLVGGCIDAAVILPVWAIITFIVSKVANVHLPSKKVRLVDVDMWVDFVLATDPAVVMGLIMLIAIALTYLLVVHITLGRTIGMRTLKMKIIDVYGDPPSPARCVVRCLGYLAGFATLFLGFLWIGFDSEKRGVQDWIAGTYVIRV